MSHARSFAAFTLACLLAGCSSPLADPLGDAQASLENQDYFAARDHAQEALREMPGDAGALTILARAQIAMGEGANAIATLDRLNGKQGAPADFTLLYAEARLQAEQADEALALIAEDKSAEAWRLRALAASREGDYAAALAAFAKGQNAGGDSFRLNVAEASWHLARGNAEAARQPVARAQTAFPDRVETFFVTARLAQLDEDAELATRAFMGILKVTPLDRPALLGAIAEMGNMGRIDLLRPLVERGHKAYPNDAEFVYLAARLMAVDGDWEGARDLLQERESTLAQHPDSRGLYGEALLRLGQFDQARSLLAPLYRRQPGNAQLVRTFAEVLLETGETQRASEVIAPLASSPQALPQDKELAARAAQG